MFTSHGRVLKTSADDYYWPSTLRSRNSNSNNSNNNNQNNSTEPSSVAVMRRKHTMDNRRAGYHLFRNKSSSSNFEEVEAFNDDEEKAFNEVEYTEDEEFFECKQISPFLRPRGSPQLASTTDRLVWELMQEKFRANEIEQVMPRRAKELVDGEGWILLDVRPQVDYLKRHCWQARNCQYFKPLVVTDLGTFGKQVLSLAIFPERIRASYANVQENESFIDEIVDEDLWGKKVIVYDDVGGLIGTKQMNFADGIQTPSLMAIHELIARGFGTENVKHMAGGFLYWDEVEEFDCGEAEEMPKGML